MKLPDNLSGIEVRYDFPLKEFNTFKSGGRGALFIVAHNETGLIDLLKYFYEKKIVYHLLGAGSNILIPESGVSCPVVKLGKDFSYVQGDGSGLIETGAATRLATVINYCIKNGLSGLEPLCGIPATIGGMAVMNASAHGRSLLSLVKKVNAIDRQGVKQTFLPDQITAGYRTSSLKDFIVTSLVLALEKKSRVRDNAARYFAMRQEKQDYAHPSLGCVFKNPDSGYAGQLIEQCGLKGLSIGGAAISSRHANFIINKGNAGSDEVAELIEAIKKKVRERFSLELEEEIIRW